MKRNKKHKPILVMTPGKLYRLSNVSKNRVNQYMAVSKAYGNTLRVCRKIGHPWNAKRYSDGDVFLCLALGQNGLHHHVTYKVLTPDGVVATLFAYRNKSKFIEVT